jgi:hypothetical protein
VGSPPAALHLTHTFSGVRGASIRGMVSAGLSPLLPKPRHRTSPGPGKMHYSPKSGRDIVNQPIFLNLLRP